WLDQIPCISNRLRCCLCVTAGICYCPGLRCLECTWTSRFCSYNTCCLQTFATIISNAGCSKRVIDLCLSWVTRWRCRCRDRDRRFDQVSCIGQRLCRCLC